MLAIELACDGKNGASLSAGRPALIMAVQTITLPDERRLCAIYEGDEVGWVVFFEGDEDHCVASVVLTDALTDLLDINPDDYPSWVRDAVDELAGRDTPFGRRFGCHCCGFLTLSEAPTGTYEICKVCFWEDDGVQSRDPDFEGGANTVSLNQARENFRLFGVSEPRFQRHVRPPLPEEQP